MTLIMNVIRSFITALPKALPFRSHGTVHYLCSCKNMSTKNDINNRTTIWDPINIFNCPPSYKYAVIILNRPIYLDKSIVLPLWKKAEITATVDGGTDQWIKYLGSLGESVCRGENLIYAPTMITGDMDSISQVTREMMQKIGVKIIKTPNQNYTDYTKAIIEIAKHCESHNIKLNGIYVLVDTTGRFDHILGNVNTLYKSPDIVGDTQVIQVATNSLTWLMRPGKHRIIIPEVLINNQAWCGVVPFGTRVEKASTTGLKWNLDNLTMEFGGLISTSNTYDKNCKEVTIDLNDNIVWTMGIEPLVDRLHSS